MFVALFAYSKKKNSTARPALTSGTTFTVDLKEETAVMNPVLIFDPASSGMPVPFDPASFNYALIVQWNRYYFINDWRWLNGRWEASLSVDVLATYKTGIGTLSEYVLRSSNTYDGAVTDTIYPVKNGIQKNRDGFSMALSQTGLYVVGIINNASYTTDGAVTYYIMNNTELATLKSYLMSDTFLQANGLDQLADMSKDLVKAVFNPFQYIVSCRFIPIDYATATAQMPAVTAISVGWWSIPCTAKRMLPNFYMDITADTVTAGTHPQASRGDYLNHAPYTERVIIHPLIGTVSLDSNKIDAGDSITIFTRVDFTTGDATIYIDDSTKQITLYTTSIRLAIDVQLAQIAVDKIAVAQNAVNTVGGAISSFFSGNITGVITSAASGILNHLACSQPIMQTSGVNGNRSIYHIQGLLYAFYRLIVDEDNAHLGRPLCQPKTINTISGYIKCCDAHAEINCLGDERTLIVEYMNNGFYYE